MDNMFPLKRVEAHFKRVVQYVPVMLANDALNFFLDSFNRQGWLGDSFQPWQRRKVNKGRSKGRAILIDSARLKRGERIVSITNGVIIIGNSTPYAKAHNDGFRGIVNVSAHSRNKYKKEKLGSGKFTKAGKERMKTVQRVEKAGQVVAHTRRLNMPRRQFMGSSPYLTKLLQRRLQAEFMKGLR